MPQKIILGGAGRNVVFTIFNENREKFFRGTGGAVDNQTQKVGKELHKVSKTKIGKTYSGDHGSPRLKESGKLVRAETAGRWKLTFRHRAAEVHYAGNPSSYEMPKKTGSRKNVYARRKRVRFGPTRGPIFRKPLKGNPYIQIAAREMGLIVSDKPILERLETSPGVIRIPRGFA